MATVPLSPLQAIWLTLDSKATPMHVGGLYIFEPPEDAPADYLRKLASELRRSRDIPAPWNRRLVRGPGLGIANLPLLSDDAEIDMDYHVRHSALPAPGGERELGELISRIHSHHLDMTRPLWECHLIDGLYGGRFVLYLKMHQILLNGAPGLSVLLKGLVGDKFQRGLSPVWGIESEGVGRPINLAAAPQTLLGAAKAAMNLSGAYRKRDQNQALPFDCPRTKLEGRISYHRRVATQTYDGARVDKVLALADCTHTELVQYLVGSALRRFLKEYNALPEQDMTAGIPIWPDGDYDRSPSLMPAYLGTDVADRLKRLEKVRASYAKAQAFGDNVVQGAGSAVPYSLSLVGSYMASRWRGIGAPRRNPWNVFLTCQEGPEEPLYFNGAKLDAVYPIMPLWQGNGIAVSSARMGHALNVSLVGDRKSVV